MKSAEEEKLEELNGEQREYAKLLSTMTELPNGSKKLPEKYTGKGAFILVKCLSPFCVWSNSAFVFDTVKKCIDEHIDCKTFASFLASLPEAEFTETGKMLKEFLLKQSK